MTHPDPAFAWTDRTALMEFARSVTFAQIAVVANGRPILAQAPILVTAEGAIHFHLARTNAASRWIDAAPVAVSLLADDFYVSPDWYASADQVPTWNYRHVEAHGIARRLTDTEVRAQFASLSVEQEERLSPKPAWTIDKLPPARLEAMLRAVTGFAIDAPDWRGTVKMGQNKAARDRAGVAEALRQSGRPGLAALMEPAA